MLLAALAAALAEVASTPSRTAKAGHVAAVLQAAEPAERPVVVRYLEGELPQRRTGLGWRSLAGLPGPAASASLSVLDVDAAFTAAQEESGPGSGERRRRLLVSLFAASTGAEQRLLAGLVSGELRQGAGRGVLTEAVAVAAGVPVALVRRALTLAGDVAEVADLALAARARDGVPGAAAALEAVRLRLGRPLSPMLAASAPDVTTALGRAGGSGRGAGDGGDGGDGVGRRDGAGAARQVEWKLDGVRVQVHRTPERPDDPREGPGGVRVWTRSLEDVTHRLPEVVAAVAALPARSLVLDGEVLGLGPAPGPGPGSGGPGGPGGPGDEPSAGWRSRRPVPFQQTSARVAAGPDGPSVDLALVVFDVLHLDGEDLLQEPLERRRAVLTDLAGHLAVPATRVDAADGAPAAEAFAADALARGHEGVVVKDLGAAYAAGRRGAGWVKVKPRLTLDLVVLAVEHGSGRRTGWLSNLHLGARDVDGRYGPPGGLVMLGKTFKGLTDAMLAWQTERLGALAVSGTRGRVDVRPELVVEVAFDGVQDSPRYPAGVALRFARVVAHRPDKPAAEADTVEAVLALHAAARGLAAGAEGTESTESGG